MQNTTLFSADLRCAEDLLPQEFRSGNSVQVERATITRERMIEIIRAIAPVAMVPVAKVVDDHDGSQLRIARTLHPLPPEGTVLYHLVADSEAL